jgi:hypothetical protein
MDGCEQTTEVVQKGGTTCGIPAVAANEQAGRCDATKPKSPTSVRSGFVGLGVLAAHFSMSFRSDGTARGFVRSGTCPRARNAFKAARFRAAPAPHHREIVFTPVAGYFRRV